MIIKLGIINADDQIKNIVANNQMIKETISFEVNQTKPLITAKTGTIKYINETTGELIFENESFGLITFGRVFSPEDLKLPDDKEKQAINIALNDSRVKEVLADKEYNITKVQKVAITTMNQTYLSENNVMIEIEIGTLTYFVNVEIIQKAVMGDVVPVPKIEITKDGSKTQ
ncbi:MAG: hypothetical protein IBX39_05605 [Candidatus Methanoperedenaceae archaeon]|nr:hypothetical protein [Candidatus Methanoperedenaceae archaeon]MDW7727622.1 hypothetical protein [Candidatus Methanoperedens sp.]